MHVGIWNPLPQVLHHFEQSLMVLLDELDGVSVTQLDAVPIEMPSDATMIDRVVRMGSMVRKVALDVRRHDLDVVINLWPALGFVDIPIWSLSGRAHVHHCSRPVAAEEAIRRGSAPRAAVKYSRAAGPILGDRAHKLCASCRGQGRLARPHRSAAAGAAAQHRSQRRTGSGPPSWANTNRHATWNCCINWGAEFISRGVEGLIVGRGWPPIEGWKAVDRFVEEEEFDTFVRVAACVLIPYKDYYQSDVAIRAF